jgi:hypothetical protein
MMGAAAVAPSTAARLRSIPFAARSELVEAAWNHGYRAQRGEADGWLFFASAEGVPGEIALAVADSGSAWFLSVEHPGVAAELNAPHAAPPAGNGYAAFGFATQVELRRALSRVFDLATSLPTLPLSQFEEGVAGLGDSEVDRIVRQRVGQDVFRAALMVYWEGRCVVTGIAEPALLRASHIVPWAKCASDAERLDVHNGLLLAAHWDAAFDAGLVSFDDAGAVLVRSSLDAATLTALAPDRVGSLMLTEAHRRKLIWHRQHFGF